ncbi:tetratricopeptide repeat protein [Kutzneria sp. NPDC052558]|uniref:tetratricopeptide repeat protein n=1 Tax=Kutzneria sp. NPDC052558 TaxID=3364121 RepID=UPI0037CBBD9C
MEFRILGPVEVLDDTGTQVALAPKVRAVLAVLLLNLDTPITNDALGGWLWGEDDYDPRTLYKYIRDLRAVLSSTFGTAAVLPRSTGLQRLILDPDYVDYHRFSRHTVAARSTSDPHVALTAFGAAIAEFRGEPLSGITGGRLNNLRTGLDHQWREACYQHATYRLALGQHSDALSELNHYLARWPNDERFYTLRISVMAADGRQAEISADFARYCRDHDASDALRDHVRHVRSGRGTAAPGRARTFPYSPVQSIYTEKSRWRFGVVPARAACFQQRHATRQLTGALDHGGTIVLTGAGRADVTLKNVDLFGTRVLSGLGGVGKTQLAADYAHTLWGEGQIGLLVWITASSQQVILSSYASLFTELTGIDERNIERGARRLLAWLATTDTRWLVVLDDLQSPAHLRALWPPHTGNGRVIVTTRRRDAALAGDHRHLVEVGLFTPEDSLAFLTARLAARPAQVDGAAQLAEELGHLPLALGQAAVYIADRQTMTCAEYLSRFVDQRRRLLDLLPDADGLPDDYQATVAATWSLSIERANQLMPPGLARPTLELASVLDPNGIPMSMFIDHATLAHVGATVGREVDAEDLVNAASCLHRLSLITLDPDAPNRAVRIHALVQRASRDTLTPERIATVVRNAADALLEIWPEVEHEDELAQVLRANAAALCSVAENYLWHPDAHEILFRYGESLSQAGLLTIAIDYHNWLFAGVSKMLGADHPAALRTRHNLAGCYGETGDWVEAANRFETLLVDSIRILGPDHPSTLRTRQTLAYSHCEAGNPAKAVELFHALLTDRQRVQGNDHPETLRTRHNLAYSYGRAGDSTRAVEQLETLLSDRQRLTGADHPTTLNTRHELAYLQGRVGDFVGAVELFKTLVADRQRILGDDHPSTLRTRHNLAYWLGEAGDPVGAVGQFEVLLADSMRVLGLDHPDTLTARLNLARWRGEAGDPSGAIDQFEALLEDDFRILGPDHPDTLRTRSSIARWTGNAGDPNKAVELFKALLADRLRVLGPNHPDILDTRQQLTHWQWVADTEAGP